MSEVLVEQRVYQGSGLLAVLSRDLLHQPLARAQFFAVPDPVAVQNVLFPLRPAYTVSHEVPVHHKHFPIAPFSRWFVNEARVEYFVREAAAAGVDVLDVDASFDEPDISGAINEYQRMLGVDGVRADEAELVEQASVISSCFGGSLEHHLSEDFFVVSRYLRDSVQQQVPLRSWELDLFARYVADERLPGSVLRQGLSEVGLSLSEEFLESLESQQTMYASAQFPLSRGFAHTVLFREINNQLYGPL